MLVEVCVASGTQHCVDPTPWCVPVLRSCSKEGGKGAFVTLCVNVCGLQCT